MSNLNHGGEALEQTRIEVSSMVDTWLLLKMLEADGERNRCLYVLKSRGMAHSNQIREFLITHDGIDLVEPYVGPEGVLTGAARAAQELRERLAADERRAEDARRARVIGHKRALVEQQIAALRADFAAEEADLISLRQAAEASREAWASERLRAAQVRGASRAPANGSVRHAPYLPPAAVALRPGKRRTFGRCHPFGTQGV